MNNNGMKTETLITSV